MRAGPPPSVRGIGFGSRATLMAALAWMQSHTSPMPDEAVPAHLALGRVLTSAPPGAPWPPAARAALDGYAVRAAGTEGASDYNLLPLPDAIPIAAGEPMPPGTDAVVPFAAVAISSAVTPSSAISGHGPVPHAIAPVASGTGVDRRGTETSPRSRLIRPEDAALLALLGVQEIRAVRRPRVALVVAGPKSGPDVLTPLLTQLVARDGGLATAVPGVQHTPADADLLILVGRTGCGLDDDMPDRLQDAGGVLDMHGIAFRPGDTAGLGRLGKMPAMLLPGTPLAALSIYEALASPAVRRLAGLGDISARTTQSAILDRKVTSLIGCTDMVRVRLHDGRATPLGPADTGGLARATQSDGWIIIPDGLEGYTLGTTVTVECPLP